MNTKIEDNFYIEKFMEIQRANVVLWRKLKTLEENNEVVNIVGKEFFKGLDDLVK